MYARLVVFTVFACALTGCLGPVRTDKVYAQKLAKTADQALSGLQTAQLFADAPDQNTTGTYAAVILADVEDDVSSAQQTFDSLQPPSPHAVAIRSSVDPILSDAVSAISDMRIAAKLGRSEQIRALALQLPKLIEQLQAVEQKYQDA
jgi:hypothetical protein